MTRDYGVRLIHAGPPLGRAAVAGLVVLALAMVPVGLAQQQQDRQAAIAEARAWMAPGPPCPVVSRLTDIGFLPSLRTVQFDGIRFGRAYSYMMCSDITDDGGKGQGVVSACRFNDPMVVEVTTPKTHVIFFTRTQPATISIDHGQPSCVLNPSRSIYD
ncbi:MAG TPA: hypothetical protein VII42_05675 [Caulobacteraceae bacterium]